MATYISILRGINVSGSKVIKMDALRKTFEALGFKNVQTYIQSGNIVFQCKQSKTESLEKKIHQQIETTFGFDVATMVLEVDYLKTIIKKNPFIKDKSKDVARMHVTFLSAIPTKELHDKIKMGDYKEDEFILIGKAIYLHVPISYGNSKLSNNFFENKLKVAATTRNWKTVNELLRMAEEV
jgi:uncharacterized protein (DUF1697 family)